MRKRIRQTFILVEFVKLFADGVVALGPLEFWIEPPRLTIKLIHCVMKIVTSSRHFSVLDISQHLTQQDCKQGA